MKKDRNSFFSQFGSYGYNNQPYMQPGMNMQPPAMPQVSSNMSYQMNQPATVGTAGSVYPMDDNIDARISKLEREINRMDSRISKLEQTQSSINATNTDYNFANSMYMV